MPFVGENVKEFPTRPQIAISFCKIFAASIANWLPFRYRSPGMEGKGRRKLGSGLKAGAQLSGWQRGTRFSPNLKRGNLAETASPTSVPLGGYCRATAMAGSAGLAKKAVKISA